jgi:hypothetical protein
MGLFATAGCNGDVGTVGAPEHFSPMVVDSSVGPLRLQLWVWPKDVVFRRSDSIMINYRIVNPGPGDHAYRDAAEYYYFRVIGPDSRRLYPNVVSATAGIGGAQRILLYPGEAGETRTINLAACRTTRTPSSRSSGRRTGTGAKPRSSFGPRVRIA